MCMDRRFLMELLEAIKFSFSTQVVQSSSVRQFVRRHQFSDCRQLTFVRFKMGLVHWFTAITGFLFNQNRGFEQPCPQSEVEVEAEALEERSATKRSDEMFDKADSTLPAFQDARDEMEVSAFENMESELPSAAPEWEEVALTLCIDPKSPVAGEAVPNKEDIEMVPDEVLQPPPSPGTASVTTQKRKRSRKTSLSPSHPSKIRRSVRLMAKVDVRERREKDRLYMEMELGKLDINDNETTSEILEANEEGESQTNITPEMYLLSTNVRFWNALGIGYKKVEEKDLKQPEPEMLS